MNIPTTPHTPVDRVRLLVTLFPHRDTVNDLATRQRLANIKRGPFKNAYR